MGRRGFSGVTESEGAAVIGVSMPMNHCSVARTMIGLWQRQQWGVRVIVGGCAEECALFFEEFDDDRIRFKDGEVFVGLRCSATTEGSSVALEGRRC